MILIIFKFYNFWYGHSRDYFPREPEKLRYVTSRLSLGILLHVANAGITGLTSPIQIVA